MVKGLEYLLKELGLFSLEKSLKDLIHVYKHPVAGSKLLFMFKQTLLYFSLCPLPPALSLTQLKGQEAKGTD